MTPGINQVMTLAQRQMYYNAPSPWLAYAFLALAGLAVGAFWAWMLLELLTKEPAGPTRNTWLLVVLLLSVVGAMAYYFIRRPVRGKGLPR